MMWPSMMIFHVSSRNAFADTDLPAAWQAMGGVVGDSPHSGHSAG